MRGKYHFALASLAIAGIYFLAPSDHEPSRLTAVEPTSVSPQRSKSEIVQPPIVSTQNEKINQTALQENLEPPVETAKVFSPAELECQKSLMAKGETSDLVKRNSEKLNKLVGTWFFSDEKLRSDHRETTPSGLFIQGLARAGLLAGRNEDLNLNEALSLMKEAASSDPENAAPLIYQAIIEQKLGNKDESLRLLQMANQRSKFDTYIKTITKTLYSEVKSPEDWLAVHQLAASLPFPEFDPLKEVAKENGLSQIGKILIADGANPKNKEALINWDPLEYMIGMSILIKTDPQLKLKPFRQLAQEKRFQGHDWSVFTDQLYSTCDLKMIEQEIVRIKAVIDEQR